MTRLIFMNEMHQVPKLMRIAKEDDVIVSLKREISDILGSRRLKFKCLEDYPQPSEDDAIRWMKDWPIKNGKAFIEHFSYDRLSLWWLMENWLYYSSAYFDSLRDAMLSLQTIETILKQEQPDEIVFVDDGKINSEVLKLFTEYKRKIVPMELFKFLYNAKRSTKVFFISKFIDFGFDIRKLMWKLLKPGKETKGEIIFISTDEWGLAKNEAGKYIKYDPFIDPIISELNYNIKTVNIPVGRLLGLKQMVNKSRNAGNRILESYYNRGAGKRCKNAVKSIIDKWSMMKREKGFLSSFEYHHKNIWPVVERQFSAYFYSRLRGHIRDAELLKIMIEEERPRIVVYPGETSEFGKTLFHLCNVHGIPTVGIQHGTFNNYLGCIHKKGESRIGVAEPNNCPIPTKTFVYGPKYEKMLYSGNYPKGSVAVTGSQRFDRIILDRNKFDKKLLCKNLGLDHRKKTIAYVTSPLGIGDTEVMASGVVEAAKLAGVQLIIKLHPSESFTIYKKVANEAKSNVALVRDIDLYDVLDACDIMITHLSTAAIEAMIFGKPVIILNLTGKPDRIDYVKKGAAFGVYRKEDLLQTIQKLLYDRQSYSRRLKKIRSFVFETAYLADGKSSKRMAEAIEKLIRKK